MAEYHVLGLFDDVEPATESLKRLHDLGLSERAVTLLSAMPLPESWPGPAWIRQRGAPFAVLGAILGIGLGLVLTAGLYLLYQINTGLQPLIPIPTSGIIIFELTMLGIMATTFVGFLIINRMPAFSRPTYDVRVTEGKIGVLARVGDSLAGAVENALQSAGANEVKRLPPQEHNTALWNRAVVALLAVAGAALIVLLLFSYDFFSIPLPTNMANQESVGFQQGPRLAAPAEAVPIQGPVLINGLPASKPLPATADSLERGKALYGINCALCHGSGGKGDGNLSVYFTPKPFDLTSQPVQRLQDQDIFLVISGGFAIMPQIGENLSVDQRWDIVNYVRTLK